MHAEGKDRGIKTNMKIFTVGLIKNWSLPIYCLKRKHQHISNADVLGNGGNGNQNFISNILLCIVYMNCMVFTGM